MDLLHLVDRLEELVAGAAKMPIGNRVILDRRKLLDVVDQMRVVTPQEVRDARDIVERQDELKRGAEEEARIIVARAEEQASRLIDGHEVTAAARERAETMSEQANARLEERIAEANEDVQDRIAESRRLAGQQMADADAYSVEMLRRLERQLEAFVRSVRAGLVQLEPDDDPLAGAVEAATSISLEGSNEAEPPGSAEAEPPEDEHEPVELDTDHRLPAPAATLAGTASATGDAAAPAPIPIRVDAADAAEAGSAELENLLDRPLPAAGGVEPLDDDNVIDDFAQPRFDDEGKPREE
ncbi:MAG: hypothetical protein QF664_13020 [Dehalococcoidia bacterium]|jgi:hypothetical protein|nr:hypothetical protein [Dehalococcoidia bacterium]